MHIAVSEAKGQLTDLVRRAEAGEEIILTRHGHPAVRLVAIKTVIDKTRRRAVLDQVRTLASTRSESGASAARSQDFLYGDDGLPE